jgi:ElaB/YqjD/DUF883 family membrane-anchored ribosome-binding protein
MYGNNAGLATDPNTSSTTMSSDNLASSNVSARHQETMAQLNRTVTQAEELLRALGNESGEAIDAMRARVSATLRDARERLSGRAGQARAFANNTMSEADAFVHANPWRAVAIGAGIGALLAILLSGSRRHSGDGDGVDYT